MSTRHDVQLSNQAEKTLRKLPKDLRRRVDRVLLDLETNPRPPGCEKVTKYPGQYKVRVGDYRIRYAVEDDRLIVLVIVIERRDKVYR